jgi:hypothetical protein
MKKSTIKPKFTQRIEAPIAKKEKDGSASLYCPFCKPSHKIMPGMEALCGTRLEVRAVQIVFKAKYEKDMKCAKCGQGGGEMVRFQNAFIHANDCTPGVATLTEAPKFSKWAQIVWGIPWPALKARIEKRTGKAMPVDEVTPDGARTGVVLGHFFFKG